MKLLIFNIFLYFITEISSFSVFPATSQHPVKPKTISNLNKYMPTNSWYQNLLIGTGENAVQTYPYIIKINKNGLIICYPSQMVNQNNYILEVFNSNLAFSVREAFSEPLLDQSTVNNDFFDLSAKINFGTKFDVILVRGSASILINIKSATPALKTIHAILKFEVISEKSVKLILNNDQQWIIQSQSKIQWSNSGSEIYSQSQYTGWLKISISNSNSESVILNSHDSIITNGRVSYSIESDQVKVKVDYFNQGLYYLLPHVINPSNTLIINGATLKGIKGIYRLSKGNGYEYNLPIYQTSNTQIAINSEEKRNKLKEALNYDVDNLKIESKDPYFGGKELARTARLIEIADLLNDSQSKTKAKNLLTNELDAYWFGISNRNPALVYEPTWGGIVSKQSVGSPETDFGIYYYNDHHFHYGYFINAASTLAKHYPDYYASRSEYFKLILSDYSGACLFKELPCKPRNKDPFLGHSFASGLFEFSDSRNQESTSEAINSYLAVRELGKAINNKTLEDLGNYLLSSEIHATKIYWQIKNPSPIYSEPYSKNGVVGILWETKIDYATFFGINVEFIYGIQMLPFNEITPAYLDRSWLRETRPIWSVALNRPDIEEGWKGFLLLADAIVDPQKAGLSNLIHNLKEYDNGNCRTNTLYFYYLVGGLPSGSVQISTITPSSSTISGSISVTTSRPISTQCSGLNCNGQLGDNGKPDSNCGVGLYGCHNLAGLLNGCYNPSTAICFFGGYICPKPLSACIIGQSFQCYDSAVYQCLNGNLVLNGLIG